MAKLTAHNKGKLYPGEVLSPEELTALLDRGFPDNRRGIRDRAITAVAVFAGLRVSETLSLRPCDIPPNCQSVTIMSGKGRKRGVVGINPRAIPYIEAWRARRGTLAYWLFHTDSGRRIGERQYRKALADAAVRAGITRRCHPHCLRHTCAVELAKKNTRMDIIQRQLRHSNLGTTATYLSHFNPQEVIDTVSGIEW